MCLTTECHNSFSLVENRGMRFPLAQNTLTSAKFTFAGELRETLAKSDSQRVITARSHRLQVTAFDTLQPKTYRRMLHA